MIKSLKSKITLVYICLVLTIALVGMASVISLYSLNKSINALVNDNYKSIDAVNDMLEAVQDENTAILNYIQSRDESNINLFFINSDIFHRAYIVESNNVTEPGENELVLKINEDYNRYSSFFSELQETKSKNGFQNSIDFYNTNMLPEFNKLKQDLEDLSILNETAMFRGKSHVVNNSRGLLYTILVISLISVIGGFFISRHYINKFLMPVTALTETVKAVKEGDLNQQAPVVSKDEIGALSIEFNKMTKRLLEYDQSNAGKLLAEKNKSIAIVKSISDPLMVLDTDYKIVLINKACESFFNIKEEEVLTQRFFETLRNNDLYEHILNVVRNKKDNKDNKSKIINFISNNKDYYFNVIVNTVNDMDSNITGIVVLFQNVTQLKQLEKMKTNFISTISHEFKTPLTSIMIGISLITDENIGELNEKQKRIIDTIKEDSDRLSELVTNLLQLSRIESDKSIFDIQPCSIFGIIQNCVKNFYDVAESKEINLYYEADENLPKINADPEKISWVINNLISNALKFTNAGDEISLAAQIHHGEMCISVKDTGIGIPEQYMDRIFNKFIQVKDNNSETHGTGLGLAIAKEIVEAHGGEIWCESKLDLGSTFTFTLTLAE